MLTAGRIECAWPAKTAGPTLLPRRSPTSPTTKLRGLVGEVWPRRVLPRGAAARCRDQNRFSHWSPIAQLEVPAVTQVEGDVGVSGNIIQTVWSDEENRPSYDVFVDFDNSGYSYHGTTPIHTYSFLSNISYSTVQVAIQVASIEKERASSITIFESPEINLVELS